jgi:TatD DNase family protein
MIDFHCHLDLYPNPDDIVRECISRGVHALSVTTTPSAWEGSSALVAHASRIRVALGLHPELARERRQELALFDELLPKTRYVGEIGLDGSPKMRRFWADQKYVFDYILAACQVAGGKVMTIHSRRAASEVLDSLEAHPGAGIPILHWYSGGQRELGRAIDWGCWFSIGPSMLSGKKGRDLVARMPRDRILTETDGPFALVDGRHAFPWDVDRAIGMIADLWAVDASFVRQSISENLRTLSKHPLQAML